MSIHKKTKQNSNNNNYTIHTRSQKSTNTSAIWVNSNILKSLQDELYLRTALGFSILRSISRKSRELVWAEERDILRDILFQSCAKERALGSRRACLVLTSVNYHSFNSS